MAELTIYYSVENCGDGSAVPKFFATAQLADWHQEHLSEGWGEPCVGSLMVTGDNMLCPDAITAEMYLKDLLGEIWDDDSRARAKDFIATFFPDGLPQDLEDAWHRASSEN